MSYISYTIISRKVHEKISKASCKAVCKIKICVCRTEIKRKHLLEMLTVVGLCKNPIFFCTFRLLFWVAVLPWYMKTRHFLCQNKKVVPGLQCLQSQERASHWLCLPWDEAAPVPLAVILRQSITAVLVKWEAALSLGIGLLPNVAYCFLHNSEKEVFLHQLHSTSSLFIQIIS